MAAAVIGTAGDGTAPTVSEVWVSVWPSTRSDVRRPETQLGCVSASVDRPAVVLALS